MESGSSSVENRKSKSLTFIVIGIIVAIVGYFLWVDFGQEGQNETDTAMMKEDMSPAPAITSSISQYANSDYRKRLYDVNKEFAAGKPFPAFMGAINDNDLVDMKCTDYLVDEVYGPANPNFYLDSEDGGIVSNEMRINLVRSANIPADRISGVQFCLTDDNRIIWSYNLGYATGDGSVVFMSGSVDGQSSEIGSVSIPSGNNYQYFACAEPLMLTRDGKLYYECFAQSGGIINSSGVDSIYEIDLNNKIIKNIYSCISEPTDMNQRNSPKIVTCTES